MPRPVIAKPARTLVVAALLLGSAGCSDESSSEAAPEPTPTTSSAAGTATPGETTEPTDTGSADATAELPFPGVTPATAMELKEKTVSVHVPPGWTRAPSTLTIDSGVGRGSSDFIHLGDQDQFGSFPDMSTDDLTKVLMRGNRQLGGTYERADDLMIDGFPVVRITGIDRNGLVQEQYAASREGRLVTLTITMTKEGVRKEPDLIPSVVNSWTWR